MNEEHVALDASTPEIDALREALRRATDARAAAERALRDAEQAEAAIAAEEQRAIAAITAERQRLDDVARTAAEREREALASVASVETQLEGFVHARDKAQAAADAVQQALNEAKATLERLLASAAEHEREREAATEQTRSVETELRVRRQRAADATREREEAETALAQFAQPPEPTAQPKVAESDPIDPPQPAAVSDFTTIAARRAAERRAADAARAWRRP